MTTFETLLSDLTMFSYTASLVIRAQEEKGNTDVSTPEVEQS